MQGLLTKTYTTVSPDMLLRWLSSSFGPNFYFGNSDWYAEWLGTIDNWYPAYHLDLRTHPFSNPLPPLAFVYLAAWTEDGEVIPKNVGMFLSFDSSEVIQYKLIYIRTCPN
jgi:hypothetical protein